MSPEAVLEDGDSGVLAPLLLAPELRKKSVEGRLSAARLPRLKVAGAVVGVFGLVGSLACPFASRDGFALSASDNRNSKKRFENDWQVHKQPCRW